MAAQLANLGPLLIELYCSDSWLSTLDVHGQPHQPAPGDDTTWRWDSRGTRPDPNEDGWVNLGEGGCDSSTPGFTIATMWGGNVDVITFCQEFFSTWNEDQSGGETLQDVCSQESTQGTSLESLVRDKLARTIVHEFMHSLQITKLPPTSLGESPVSKSTLGQIL
jgi:hypothetical protein